MSRKETTYLDEDYLNYLENNKEEYIQMFEKENSSQNQVPVNVLATEPKISKIDIKHTIDMGVKMAYVVSNLSLFAQKLFYTALSEIRSDDKDFHEINFEVKDIINTFKMDKANAWRDLHKAIVELYKADIFLWNEASKALRVNHLLDSIELVNKKAVKISISQKIANHFLHLKNYFYKVPLEYLLDLPTPNSMRLFYLLYGYFYYYQNSYSLKANRKSKNTEEPETVKFKIPYVQLKTMFEAEKYETYLYTRKMGKDKYPTFKRFSDKVLGKSLEYINEKGILHVEVDKIFNQPQLFFEDNKKIAFIPPKLEEPRTSRRVVTHLEFTITKGAVLLQKEQEKANNDTESFFLRMICEYFKARFDINKTVIKQLLEEGYTYTDLMLAGISMQSILNLSSRGLWIYTSNCKKDPNWKNAKLRKETYIKEYQQIAIPNLGLTFDDNSAQEYIIHSPVGFLRKTLEEEKYYETIDAINSEKGNLRLGSFGDKVEKLYTKSFYDEKADWDGDKFKELIRSEEKDFDLIFEVFKNCHYGAKKLNTNENWFKHFYKNGSLNIHWKEKFYKSHSDWQQAMNEGTDRKLKLRNLV